MAKSANKRLINQDRSSDNDDENKSEPESGSEQEERSTFEVPIKRPTNTQNYRSFKNIPGITDKKKAIILVCLPSFVSISTHAFLVEHSERDQG